MVDVVASYIASHYRQNLELKELAALAGCSVRQLQRRFKQEKQLGPMEYVIQLRMESASRMLRHTDASIGEIADKLGYRDMYYFSRAFKSMLASHHYIIGMPPRREPMQTMRRLCCKTAQLHPMNQPKARSSVICKANTRSPKHRSVSLSSMCNMQITCLRWVCLR